MTGEPAGIEADPHTEGPAADPDVPPLSATAIERMRAETATDGDDFWDQARTAADAPGATTPDGLADD